MVILDAGNLSLARNAGVAAAAGDMVAFLDGDDLFGSTCLAEGYAALKADTVADTVLHPQYSVLFGEEVAFWEHIGMESPDLRLEHLMFENYFTALAFTTAAILRRFPYRPIALRRGFGYEDWAWNWETAQHGVRHIVVPGTLHAIRRRRASQLLQSRAGRVLRIPTPVRTCRSTVRPSRLAIVPRSIKTLADQGSAFRRLLGRAAPSPMRSGDATGRARHETRRLSRLNRSWIPCRRPRTPRCAMRTLAVNPIRSHRIALAPARDASRKGPA